MSKKVTMFQWPYITYNDLAIPFLNLEPKSAALISDYESVPPTRGIGQFTFHIEHPEHTPVCSVGLAYLFSSTTSASYLLKSISMRHKSNPCLYTHYIRVKQENGYNLCRVWSNKAKKGILHHNPNLNTILHRSNLVTAVFFYVTGSRDSSLLCTHLRSR